MKAARPLRARCWPTMARPGRLSSAAAPPTLADQTSSPSTCMTVRFLIMLQLYKVFLGWMCTHMQHGCVLHDVAHLMGFRA